MPKRDCFSYRNTLSIGRRTLWPCLEYNAFLIVSSPNVFYVKNRPQTTRMA
jgi:hypothetical protein